MEQEYAKIEKGINLKGSRCMLNIYYGDMQESVYNTAAYFKYDYEYSWIIDPFVKEMIQDVDHCTVISSHVIDSPILGAITPRELSGGVKVLILMLKDDSFIYNMSGIIGFPTTIFVDNAGNIVGDPIVGSDIAATEEYIKSMNKE